jgi:hypothetical protein
MVQRDRAQWQQRDISKGLEDENVEFTDGREQPQSRTFVGFFYCRTIWINICFTCLGFDTVDCIFNLLLDRTLGVAMCGNHIALSRAYIYLNI